MLIVTINSSIVLISLPAIFRGIGLNPLAPGNVSYLLWMIMGFLLVTAVLVVSFGRLGDMYGRVKTYNLGFIVFALASIALSLDPFHAGGGAMWLILWRVAPGRRVPPCSSPTPRRSSPTRSPRSSAASRWASTRWPRSPGRSSGLVLGGLLAEWDWRAVFWVSVPVGVVGSIWAFRSLHDNGVRRPGRLDIPGNLLFALGLGGFLAALTYGIQPYGGHAMGWTNPWVLAGLIGGVALLAAFCVVETRVADPMFHIDLFRIRAFSLGNLAGFLAATGRGGLQFMLIIWLQGIWLPLHGYSYESTPLWAGIYLLPLTIGFLVAGPVSGWFSDRVGARPFTVGGLLVVAASFVGLVLLPTDFPYPMFAFLVALCGVGSGLFSSPNATAVMNSVPAAQRGAAAGMRGTFFNSGAARLDRVVLLADGHRPRGVPAEGD